MKSLCKATTLTTRVTWVRLARPSARNHFLHLPFISLPCSSSPPPPHPPLLPRRDAAAMRLVSPSTAPLASPPARTRERWWRREWTTRCQWWIPPLCYSGDATLERGTPPPWRPRRGRPRAADLMRRPSLLSALKGPDPSCSAGFGGNASSLLLQRIWGATPIWPYEL